jgi:hypothetical protein
MNRAKPSASFQPLHGDTVGELDATIARFERRLRRAARLLAVGDVDMSEDFYQIAIAELWELDPARFDRGEDGYLWQAMVKRMLMARRDDETGDPTRPPLALRFP